jgi:2-oxoglutarate dehydrogenase E2 component (dihydrolipoamide succinyltransferase)
MPAEIRVPVLGESVVEATVGKWLKREGDAVQAGETLVELETDKVNVEVAADEGGVISQILKGEGETVHPGESIGVIGGSNGAAAKTAPVPAAKKEPEAKASPTPKAEPAPNAEPALAAEPAPETEVRASPLAERVAEELHVDLKEVPATGPGGRVVRSDVEAFARTTAPAGPVVQEVRTPTAQRSEIESSGVKLPPPVTGIPPSNIQRAEKRVRLSRRRLTIARRLVEAQHNAAMLTTFNEVDMTAVMELRARHKDSFKERHGVGLGFMSIFTKAVIGGLKAFPQINAEIQGEELVLKEYYDIGIAIGDEEGLVVPVVRNADRLSFAEIEKTIVALVQKSKEKRLTLEDLAGGSFTITNGGIFGSLLSTPILNPPQVGILGMHKIEQRPVVANGEVVVRPMMYLALSYDHRVVDGREAVQFLVRVKELLESPERLMLEG